MRRTSLAVAGVLLAIAGLWMCVHSPSSARTESASVPSQPVTVPPVPQTSSVPTTSVPSITPQPAAKTTAQAPRSNAVPVWLSVPSVGISESIQPMGVTAAGEIEPPKGQTIWYNGSPKPGAPGISVVAGHVEFSGPDTFWRLDEVPVGAFIGIRYSDGTVRRFEVVHKESELKTKVQTDPRVWGSSKTPKLVLITCDKNSPVVRHHHLNNFLVFAVPA